MIIHLAGSLFAPPLLRSGGGGRFVRRGRSEAAPGIGPSAHFISAARPLQLFCAPAFWPPSSVLHLLVALGDSCASLPKESPAAEREISIKRTLVSGERAQKLAPPPPPRSLSSSEATLHSAHESRQASERAAGRAGELERIWPRLEPNYYWICRRRAEAERVRGALWLAHQASQLPDLCTDKQASERQTAS